MTDVPNEVPPFEHGRLRLYALDAATERGRAVAAALKTDPRDAGPVARALGAERVDPYWIDLVALADIADLGLAGYLRAGYEVPEEQLATADLSTSARHVMIVPSRAFADTGQTLAPGPELTPLATLQLGEDVGALRPMAPVESARSERPTASAEPAETGPPAKRGLRPAAILFLLLIAAAFIVLVAA